MAVDRKVNEENRRRILEALGATTNTPVPEPQSSGIGVSDFAKPLAGGAVQAAGWIPRAAGEAIRSIQDDRARRVLGDMGAPLEAAGSAVTGYGERLAQDVSPAMRQAMDDSTPTGDVLSPSTWSLGRDPSVTGYAGHAAQVLGQFVPTIAATALSRGSAGVSMLTGAATGGGAAADEESDRIRDMPADQLAALPGYQQRIASGMTPDQARSDLARATGTRAFQTTLPVSALGGPIEAAPVLRRAREVLGEVSPNRLVRTGAGAVAGGVMEGAQEVAELAAQRFGGTLETGENRDIMADTFGDFVLGSLGGGVMGGAAGAMSSAPAQGRADQPPGTPPPVDRDDVVLEPTARPEITPRPAPAPIDLPADDRPAPVDQGPTVTPPFAATQDPTTGDTEVAPGVVVNANDGALSKALVVGAQEGVMDMPAMVTVPDQAPPEPPQEVDVDAAVMQRLAENPAMSVEETLALARDLGVTPREVIASKVRVRKAAADEAKAAEARGTQAGGVSPASKQESNDERQVQQSVRREPEGNPGREGIQEGAQAGWQEDAQARSEAGRLTAAADEGMAAPANAVGAASRQGIEDGQDPISAEGLLVGGDNSTVRVEQDGPGDVSASGTPVLGQGQEDADVGTLGAPTQVAAAQPEVPAIQRPENVGEARSPVAETEPSAELGPPAFSDDEVSFVFDGLESEIGWDQIGGRIVRSFDENRYGTGEVVGRSKWIGKPGPGGRESQFWRDRPVPLNPEQARKALAKARAGEKLGKREQRFIDYAREYAERIAEEMAQEVRAWRDDIEAASQEDRHEVANELRQAGGEWSAADEAEALTVADLVERAMNAGVSVESIRAIDKITSNTNDFARTIWQAIRNQQERQEETNGTEQATADGGSRSSDPAPSQEEDGAQPRAAAEGQQPASGSPGFQLTAAAPAAAPDPAPIARSQGGLFAPPTTREVLDAERQRRQDQTDGRNATGRTDMLAGDGELFAGPRPEQVDIERAAVTPDPETATKSGASSQGRTRTKPPTPQIASNRQLQSFIGIAADSITELRESDVERVIREAPAIFRQHLTSHIASARPDLADEAQAVLDEMWPRQAEDQTSADQNREAVAIVGLIGDGVHPERALENVPDDVARDVARLLSVSVPANATTANVASALGYGSVSDLYEKAGRVFSSTATDAEKTAMESGRAERYAAEDKRLKRKYAEVGLRQRERNGRISSKTGKPFKTVAAANKELNTFPEDGEFAADGFGVYAQDGGYVLRRWETTGTGAIDPGWVNQEEAYARRDRANRERAESLGLVLDKFGNMVTAEDAARMDAAFDDDGNPRPGFDEDGNHVQESGTVTPSANTIFTEDAAAAAREVIRKRLGLMRTGIDPELMRAGITLAGYHIERGARTFVAYAKAMIADLGDGIRPYLKSWYSAVKFDPRAAGLDGMDSMQAVESANVDDITPDDPDGQQVRADQKEPATAGDGQEEGQAGGGQDSGGRVSGERPATEGNASQEVGQRGQADEVGRPAEPEGAGRVAAGQESQDAPGSDTDLERDRQDADAANEGVGQPVRAGRREAGSGAGRAAGRASGAGSAGQSILDGGSALAGSRGDSPVDQADGPAGDAGGVAEPDDGGGSDQAGGDGVQPDRTGPAEAEGAAGGGSQSRSLSDRIAEQRAAESVPVKVGDEANIRQTLPLLLPGQQEDVKKAEDRFAKPDGYGMLFTNGTGTGKTFTGLGVVKRFAKQGKTNILVMVPDDKIAADWVRSAKMLGLDITPLANTKDAGTGIVITTYANAGANDALAGRQWDMVVTDEAHKLSQGAAGTATAALETLRAITMHPRGAIQRAYMQNRDLVNAVDAAAEEARIARMSDDEREWARAVELGKKADRLSAQLREKVEAVQAEVQAAQGAPRPRVMMLSATPFAYEFSIDLAEGYLFDYAPPGTDVDSSAYNSGSARDRFFIQHFGYRMRYNKLTKPDAKVDSGIMQRQFNTWLKQQGVLSGRVLEVDKDYDRRFVLIDSAIGSRIDEALAWLDDQSREESGRSEDERWAFRNAREHINAKFDYLSRRYLLEAIKADAAIEHVKEHMALGRKVVVFHDFKKGGGFNPFDLSSSDSGINAALGEFKTRFADLVNANLHKLPSPIERFRAAIPGTLIVNGDQKKADNLRAYDTFNDDATGPQVILVQAAKSAGWSGHDTTGKHQRVLMNLGLPLKPTESIQQEGRIYRVGQASDAIFRYFNTGTSWERYAFASTIAQRASAAENLAMGEAARALRDAYIQAFEESSSDFRAGHEGEGTGGRERDKAANNALTEWDRAKTLYFGQSKRTSANKSREGKDYFATPEPVGLKMAQWADARPGEAMLEPSAGHGAIARWFRDDTTRTAVEPSAELASRLALHFGGDGTRILRDTFENLHGNNKFDTIVMNPPFGTAGRTAVDHIAKAAGHLRDGGRLVALLPAGPSASAKFDKWLNGEAERSVNPVFDHPTLGAIYRGDVVSTNASWAPSGRVVSASRDGSAVAIKVDGVAHQTHVAVQALRSIDQKGPRTETYRPGDGLALVADIAMPAVTFERAGTQVATRIVVIDRLNAGETARGTTRLDFTGEQDIGALFDALESVTIPARTKPAEQEAEQPAGRPAPAPKKPGTVPVTGVKLVEAETKHTKTGEPLFVARIDGYVARDVYNKLNAAAKSEGGWYSSYKAGGAIPGFQFKDKAARDRFIAGQAATANGDALPDLFYGEETADRLREKGGTGVSAGAIRMAVNRIVAGWAPDVRPNVVVVDNFADLPELFSRDPRLQTAKAKRLMRGAVNGKTIYIVANNIGTLEGAMRTLAHEAVGHYAMQQMLGDEGFKHVLGLLEQAHKAGKMGDVFAEVERRYGTTESAYGKFYSEAIAVMAERGIRSTIMGRILAGVRDFLRRLGFNVTFSSTELRELIAKAGRYLDGDNVGVPVGAGSPIASLADASIETVNTDSTEFKRWFGDSKVVDENGAPLVVYHGTPGQMSGEPITRFASSARGGLGGAIGFWFASDRAAAEGFATQRYAGVEPQVIDAYLSISNPKEYDSYRAFLDDVADRRGANVEARHRSLRRSLESAGHDGIVIRGSDTDGGLVRDDWVAFRPEQIKSATGNRGTFDPADPDIYHDQTGGPFYSALLSSVTAGKGAPKRGDASAWKGWLDGAQRRGDFRQAERDWLGVDAWLDAQDGPITRDAITEFIRANEVQVEDVVLGGPPAFDEWGGANPERLPEGWSVERSGDGFAVIDDAGEEVSWADTENDAIINAVVTDSRAERVVAAAPKHADPDLQLPGGTNYRELLLTLPRKEPTTGDVAQRLFGKPMAHLSEAERERVSDEMRRSFDAAAKDYRSSHFDQPNILAHVRFNERTDADGKRVLFIEEIQSDWHQAGRKNGYGEGLKRYRVVGPDGLFVSVNGTESSVFSSRADADAVAAAIPGSRVMNAPSASTPAVPDAPFKATDEWAMLAFKRMARWAAENSFDRIAWTTGEQQAERYDLSKHIDRVAFIRRGEDSYFVEAMRKGTANPVWGDAAASLSTIESVLGKEIAQRIRDRSPQVVIGDAIPKVLEGVDIKMGGDGMRAFYDKILPSAVNKWAKKFGAKAALGDAGTGSEQHVIDVTPAMRDAAMAGLPQFALADTVDSPAFKRRFGGSQVIDDEGRPLLVYHAGPVEISVFDRSRTVDGGFHFGSRQQASMRGGRRAVMTAAYLNIKNPRRSKDMGGNWRSKIRSAKSAGHDGIVYLNRYEGIPIERIESLLSRGIDSEQLERMSDAQFRRHVPEAEDSYIAFDAGQIIIGDGSVDALPSFDLAADAAPAPSMLDRLRRRVQTREDSNDPFAAENRRLREQDRTVWDEAKRLFSRAFAPGGLLPSQVFDEKISRDSNFQAVEMDVRHLNGVLARAVRSEYGRSMDDLSEAQVRQLGEALAGRVPDDMPKETRAAMVAMRQYIDALSGEYIQILTDRMIANGSDSDADLVQTIASNIGQYVHRSYRAFDDPKWFRKVPTSVVNAARQYLEAGYVEQGDTAEQARKHADVAINEILKNGTAYDSFEAMVTEGKLGAKDLSVLMRRKAVPKAIRDLLGEYHDPRVNFTKSATKMGRLIWNQRFLDRVREFGLGTFLFDGNNRPPEATAQIAAERSEVMAPLNGLWTTPDVAQAFKDALGRDQMGKVYRAVVRANGLVKMGKTVLSPTTAMRNWQSALFFSLANGHFDLTQMRKSVAAFREQVTQNATGDQFAYLRHLKELGVVYDTPYAGELKRYLEDARIEEWLEGKSGKGIKFLRRAKDMAQGFYSFGDDFWKIIGFENEKAGLIAAGFDQDQAERMAAERIRNTYPTYSMVGHAIRQLSRFPLVGTFVSFPAEIIRTTANMLRLTASDLRSDNPGLRKLGAKRLVGMSMVSAGFYALAAMTAAAFGVGDDEEEAVRELAPPWQRNSTFLYVGRDENGQLRYFDLSFLDPYGYLKRPLTAMLRNQPWQDAAASSARDVLEPFLGADIAAGALFEIFSNKKPTGGRVFNPNGDTLDQAVDIADHLRKALQPGFMSNAERLILASQGARREGSGQPYSMQDELASLLGWRASTLDTKTALYYRAFEFTDALSDARQSLTRTLRSANRVDSADIRRSKESAERQYREAFTRMQRLVSASRAAGMSNREIMRTLRLSGISNDNARALVAGRMPTMRIAAQTAKNAVTHARTMQGGEHALEIARRFRESGVVR